MKNFKEGGDYVFNFTKQIIDAVGSRLPGSEEERKGADLIAKEMEAQIGAKAVVEEFKVSPTASIGAIPFFGIFSFIALVLFYASPIASLVITACTLLFAILQVFMYTGIFDCLFPRKISKNVFAVLDPPNGEEVKNTIVYSGHNDTSWNWNLALKNPNTMVVKMVLGIVSALFLMILSIIAIVKGFYYFNIANFSGAANLVLLCLPIICIPGFYWLTIYLSYDKTIASPGAMDNLTGVGLSIYMAKYFKEHPEEHPKNCRIIAAGLGSEEAGLKGSTAFVKAHKDDKALLVNPIFLNLDSFRDYDHFNAVKGDVWLFTRFDKELINFTMDAIKEAGLKGGIIMNPVGGCDSTPFVKAGFRTVTFNAQNPVATSYYHTKNDKYEDLDMNTLYKATEVLMNLTDKVEKSLNK
ncbi:MAG: M28 family peptidase [Clostridia bacterium]